MRLSRSLGLTAAAAVALALSSPPAGAATNVQSGVTFTYAADTIAANADTALVPAFTYFNTLTMPAATTVTFTPSTGTAFTSFAAPGAGGICNGGGNATTTVQTPTSIVCTITAASTFVFLTGSFGGGTSAPPFAVSGLQAIDNPSTLVTTGVGSVPTTQILAAAANGGADPIVNDAAAVVYVVLRGANEFTPTVAGATARIDLTANGLGLKFRNVGQPNDVSKAGFLGTFGVTENNLLSATTGFNINSQKSTAGLAPNILFSTPTLPVSTAVTISGNFPTISNAFAVGGGNKDSCNEGLTATGNVVGGTVTSTSIAFTLPFTPPTNQSTAGTNTWSICLVTNGTAVIQPSSGIALVGPPNQMNNLNPITIAATASLTGGTAFPLLAGNTAFGTIQFQGAAFYFENVFGAANLYPSFFRIINPSSATTTVFTIVTKDVLSGGSQSTASPGGTSAFGTVAGTAVAPAASAPVATLQPNDATYVTADQVAASAGVTLTAGTGKATVWLMSPSSGFRASMVAQSLGTGDLINLQ